MSCIIVGGTKGGSPSSSVLGLEFSLETVNTVENYVCNLVAQMPDLPTPRFMHQAALVRGKNNSWSLLVVGGKSQARNWLKSVEILDLLPYFKSGLVSKDESGNLVKMTSSWQKCNDMNAARSNFAMIAMSNFVYVYGGIMCSGEGEMAHFPMMAEPLIERYAPQTDKWDVIKITQAPALGAFAWAQLGDESKIIILGGSNGDIMTEDFAIIDFKEETVLNKQTQFEFCTAMGKLCYTASSDSVHHIGGLNSEGVDYSLKLGETEWSPIEHNHSLLLNANRLELCYNTSVYFQ